MKEKLLSLLSAVRSQWKTPAEGRYMSYKEILSFSLGSMGEKFVYYCVSQLIISIGNVIIGNTIGIEPQAMYVIYIIGTLSGFPLTALRAKMIDNTRSMKGKYRPYIISMGLPTALIGILFMYTPYERMNLFAKCAAVLLYNIGFQFFFYFYTDVFDSLINVLSPNSIERSDVLSIKSVIENFAPSVANFFLPMVARWITGENTLYNLKVYRALFPPMLAVGFVMSLIAYGNTEEKLVVARTHVAQVRFADAFRSIARNKYFWIISLAGWIGFLESANYNILGWMYNYQHACTDVQYSLITAITGNASFWPNLVAPFLIRKYGKKKILVYSNLMSVFFIALMLPVVRRTGTPNIIWALVACLFVNNFITSLGQLLGPGIQADIRDYQQYVTGERIDGMFAAVGLIGNVVSLVTGSVLPAIYARSGLNAETAVSLGYDGANVYHVLYHPDYFIRICSVLVVASIVGAALNTLPYFFYDLTETDQKGMVNVLKIRALFEDHANGVLREEDLTGTVEIIRQAQAFAGKAPAPTDKKSYAGMKRQLGRAQARRQLRQNRQDNEKIEIAKRVLAELGRFETPAGARRLALARQIAAAGENGFLSVPLPEKEAVRRMPAATQAEREERRDLLMLLESYAAAKKATARHFPQGLVPYDGEILEALLRAEEENAEALTHALAAVKRAKEQGMAQAAAEAKRSVRALQAEGAKLGAKIKKASAESAAYYRAVKPYTDARRLLSQQESYTHLDEIFALYAQAKAKTN